MPSPSARHELHRGYCMVQVTPPSLVLERKPSSVITTPCCASSNWIETIVAVSAPLDVPRGTFFHRCPPSLEWNIAPPLPPAHTSSPMTETTRNIVGWFASTRDQPSGVERSR